MLGDKCLITRCPGCEFSPVRDDGTERRHEFNWLRTCARCERRLCRVCLADDARICAQCLDALGVPGGVR
jgi:hypothetical protein